MKNEEIVKIVESALKYTEEHLVRRATEQAIRRVLEHLQSINVIDEHARSLVQYRYINADCYPPLVV